MDVAVIVGISLFFTVTQVLFMFIILKDRFQVATESIKNKINSMPASFARKMGASSDREPTLMEQGVGIAQLLVDLKKEGFSLADIGKIFTGQKEIEVPVDDDSS